jgi:Family of unknown function (DUF5946)
MLRENTCPGCRLRMPIRETAINQSYYNTNAECWSLYTEVLATEYSNAFLFGQIHQLTVDAYAVQHAGGPHPDKSVDIHLSGLYLVLERGIRSPYVPPILQRIAGAIQVWPHFSPPDEIAPLTVCDVALCSTVLDHIHTVRKWAQMVWQAWSPHHREVAALISPHLKE